MCNIITTDEIRLDENKFILIFLCLFLIQEKGFLFSQKSRLNKNKKGGDLMFNLTVDEVKELSKSTI